jgi:hypothetical protein
MMKSCPTQGTQAIAPGPLLQVLRCAGQSGPLWQRYVCLLAMPAGVGRMYGEGRGCARWAGRSMHNTWQFVIAASLDVMHTVCLRLVTCRL